MLLQTRMESVVQVQQMEAELKDYINSFRSEWSLTSN